MQVKTVVLIDDVRTAGTQLDAVAGVLLDRGRRGARRSSSPGSRPVARRRTAEPGQSGQAGRPMPVTRCYL